MAKEKIGDWDKTKLARFVQRNTPRFPHSYIGNEVEAREALRVHGTLEISDEAVQYLKDRLGIP